MCVLTKHVVETQRLSRGGGGIPLGFFRKRFFYRVGNDKSDKSPFFDQFLEAPLPPLRAGGEQFGNYEENNVPDWSSLTRVCLKIALSSWYKELSAPYKSSQ